MNLEDILSRFVDQCNNNQRLQEMNRDWTRRIQLVADDAPVRYWIRSEAGQLTAGRGELDGVDLEVRAPLAILEGVFSGAMSPTEPYNAGDLMVRGHQDDVMRLDIITLLIWGE
ncbi:putative sterol carrier protein [Sulfobacillus acidophilus TPY]|uniref:Sterol carrier protein n=1 Tax=Sulfobacillus acidophilus (strain ATCC 700253 / DSM 10332 / NAL) TaxID=679936 RepID=G8TWU6_SULAD|nr:putative sterol carrier protein [Sulfobacillus acidophilus TPY]AEW03794.1 putative sterol carrier protein [Sulfobacillus acidophilus DSM 10332]